MLLSKTKVIIVDDSAAMRSAFSSCLKKLAGFDVVAVASDAFEAKRLILLHEPDVLLLDQEMPGIDGIRFLRLLMKNHPMPVVMLSESTASGATRATESFEAGAVEVIAKPASAAQVDELSNELARKLKNAAGSKLNAHLGRKHRQAAAALTPSQAAAASGFHPGQLILIGASTGGTDALFEILTRLPAYLPPILIVQHIPARFSKSFAARLDKHATLSVHEASQGEILAPGTARVAPGGFHMVVQWNGRGHALLLNQNPRIWHQRPSVDVLFASVTPETAARSVAIILTGMGRDGAEGLLSLRQVGCHTICQDRETSAVYGMPKAAYDLGAAIEQLPLHRIPSAIEVSIRNQSRA